MVKLPWLLLLLLFSHACFSLQSTNPERHVLMQLGGYWGSAGKAQHIDINTLIGDSFTVSRSTSSNGLVGLGYVMDDPRCSRFQLSYGINAFYLAKTSVSGYVIQEDLFTNLSYSYTLTHYPVYAVVKSTVDQLPGFTLNAGIGPNFMRADGFREHSLDGVTLPDNAFSSHTNTQFSATAGIGITFNRIFRDAPLECGYQFFYLGQGHFNKATNQILTSLNTGKVYANGLLCTITI